jgi:hypothetical protein
MVSLEAEKLSNATLNIFLIFMMNNVCMTQNSKDSRSVEWIEALSACPKYSYLPTLEATPTCGEMSSHLFIYLFISLLAALGFELGGFTLARQVLYQPQSSLF